MIIETYADLCAHERNGVVLQSLTDPNDVVVYHESEVGSYWRLCGLNTPAATEQIGTMGAWLVLADPDPEGPLHGHRRTKVVEMLDSLNVDGWIVVPDQGSGEPMQSQVPTDYIADGVLHALRDVS